MQFLFFHVTWLLGVNLASHKQSVQVPGPLYLCDLPPAKDGVSQPDEILGHF